MSSASTVAANPARRSLVVARDVVLAVVFVALFLVAVGLPAEAMALLGPATAADLVRSLAHPLVGLSVGLLATLVLQSSSVTTAVLVALCAAIELPLATAVPLVLGANLGATLSSRLAGLGLARRSSEYQRAFACASLHDIYNVCAVVVLLPLELATGWLTSAAGWLAGLADAAPGPARPAGGFVAEGVRLVREALQGVGAEGTLLAILLLVVGVGAVHQLLTGLSATMQRLLRARTEVALTRAVQGDRPGALSFGVVVALAVQSNVVTTSLLVPLVSSGVLRLGRAFPVVVGSNVGTTLTAVIASLAIAGPLALAVALVHVLFNVAAALLLYAAPPLRRLPLGLARAMGRLAARRRGVVIAGLLLVFVVLPLAGMLAFR